LAAEQVAALRAAMVARTEAARLDEAPAPVAATAPMAPAAPIAPITPPARPPAPAPGRNTPALGQPVVPLADQRPAPAPPVRAVPSPDGEDTSRHDPPFRYLALASREGFVVITNSDSGRADHLDSWLLEQPELGMLLTVLTSDRSVCEAMLHYNLRVDDDARLSRTPREYRDLESRTIYVREATVENLRARCQQLRATGALVREWKVSPPIDLPQPARSAIPESYRPRKVGGAENAETLGTPRSS
jgi:hypothetical protein